jgi:hypothetical protein
MPTNLGNLPAGQRFPNGKVQIKRGVGDASTTLNNAAAGRTISDSNGNPFQIQYTPTYPCYWIVKSNIMAHGLNDGAGWRRWDHSICITPADADGDTVGFQCPQQIYDYTGGPEWRTSGANANFRLNAGTLYTAYLQFTYVNAGSVSFHIGPQWCRIVGRIVGEGFI